MSDKPPTESGEGAPPALAPIDATQFLLDLGLTLAQAQAFIANASAATGVPKHYLDPINYKRPSR